MNLKRRGQDLVYIAMYYVSKAHEVGHWDSIIISYSMSCDIASKPYIVVHSHTAALYIVITFSTCIITIVIGAKHVCEGFIYAHQEHMYNHTITATIM